MKIILGKSAGFCYGVKRAVDGTKEELRNNELTYCLGELVHNKQVINKLKNNGLKIIDDISLAKNDKNIIIRAHGVKKEIYEIAKRKDIQLKDFTCPKVLKIHEIAEDYAKQGYYIFLCGNGNHPENIGTLSYCGKNVSIIETEEDVNQAIKKFKESNLKKLLIIAQTTYSVNRFKKINELVKENLPEDINVIIKNTICKATEIRQLETEEISKKVDYMIIIGGANSSNTKKLYEISKQNCKNSICIETADELPIDEILKSKRVGIMAGASTPQEEIQKVVDKIKANLSVNA